MKTVSFVSSYFDSPIHTNRAPYNEQLLLRLKAKIDLRIVRPISWVEVLKSEKRLSVDARSDSWNGVPIVYPTYYFVPRYLMRYRGAMFLASMRSAFNAQNIVPDVFFSSWAYPDSYATMKLARENSRPLVMSVLGSDINILPHNAEAKSKIIETLNYASAIFSPSEALKRLVVALGVEERKVHVVYSGVDTTLFRPMDRRECEEALALGHSKKRLIYVGNFKVAKGVMDFLYAVERLVAESIDFEALVIGKGEEYARISSYITEKKLGDVVKLVGEVNHKDLGAWMNASDCLCLPSYNEGLPNVVLEALSCGINVVATNVGGIPEALLCPEEHLVEPGCVSALSEKLGRALKDDNFRAAPGFEIPSYERMAECVYSHIMNVID